MVSDARQILRKPLVTEKNTWLQDKFNQWVFQVHPDANRIQVRQAVEELFPGVKVLKVRTMMRRGKPRRLYGRIHRTPATKRAIVTLRPGDKIELT